MSVVWDKKKESFGKDLTKKYEGWRSQPYKDPGGENRSIGWGFNMDDPYTASLLPDDVLNEKRGLTKEEAEPIFEKKYEIAEQDLKTYLGEDTYDKLPENIRNIATDISYNVGGPTLSKFQGFKNAVQAGDWKRAASELQYVNPDAKNKVETPWYKAVGNRAKEHIKNIGSEKSKLDLSSLNPFQVKEAQAKEVPTNIVWDEPKGIVWDKPDVSATGRTKKIFAESAKAVARGFEFSASGIGALANWLGENIEKGAEQDTWPGGLKKSPKEMEVQSKIGNTITKWGKDAYEFWQEEAMRGIETPDPVVFQGSFMENPSWTRGVAIIAQAVPSLATATAITFATQSPMAGATSLGFMEGSGQYVEARKAGRDVEASNMIGGLSSVGTSLLEVIPLTRFFRGGSKRLGKDILIGAVQEGGEEAAQSLWQNLIAKFGYDKTRALTEGMVEGFIAGAGSGGILGGATSGRGLQMDKLIGEAMEQGVSPQEIEAVQEMVKNQIVDNADKIDEILDDSAEKTTKPGVVEEPEPAEPPILPPKPPITEEITPKAMPTTEDLQNIVEQAGGKWKGIMKGDAKAGIEDTAMFDEPSGSTLAIPVSQVTPETVKAKLEAFKPPSKGGETTDEIVYRTKISPTGKTVDTGGSGLYVTPNKAYAEDYLTGKQKKVIPYKINKNAKIYEAKNVEDLHKKLFGKGVYPLDEYGDVKIQYTEESLATFRKAERRINKEIKKQGFDVINYAEESRDNEFERRTGIKPTAKVILNPSILTEFKPTPGKVVKPTEALKEPWQMTKEEIDIIPATSSGKKLLENLTPITSEFVQAFKEIHGGKYIGKLSTYKDGEPYFSSQGAEFSLRDYTNRKEELIKRFPNIKYLAEGKPIPKEAKPKFEVAIKPSEEWKVPVEGEKFVAGRMIRSKAKTMTSAKALKEIERSLKAQGIPYEKTIEGEHIRIKSVANMPKSPSGSGLAMAGMWNSQIPIESGTDIYRLKPVEFPELVSMAKELTDAYPGLKKFPMSSGMFYPAGKGKIKLHPQLFTRGHEKDLAVTLAHEIGHLVDYLPDRFLKRGNLLGRLGSLRGYMKNTFGEMDVKDKEVRKELLEVTQYLHPYDETKVPQSYRSYRRSSVELYAEALSLLLNSPGTIERMAPKFTKTFFDNLDKKLEVKEAYFAIQELMNGKREDVLYKREKDIRKMFVKGKVLREHMQNEKRLRKVNMWEHIRQYVDDINRPILKKIQDNEANGVPDTQNLKYELQEHSMVDIENHLMLTDFDKDILHPLEEAGLNLDDLGEYVFLKRIVGQPDVKTEDIPEYEKYDERELEAIKKSVEGWTDRKDIPNPLGMAPETSREQLDFLRNQIGDVNFAKLEELAQKLHDVVYKSVEEAVRVGAYNKKVFAERIEPNKGLYVSFGVLNHLQNYVPATVKMQKGTLSEIENPIVTTILKTISLNRLNAKQRALNAFRDSWKEQFPNEIKSSKIIRLDKGISRLIEARPGSGFGTVKMMEDGKLVGYDVDQYIADVFDKSKTGDIQLGMMINNMLGNNIFKNLYITYNPGFAFAFNPVRDFKRTYINLKALGQGVSLRRLLIEYVKRMPDSIKRQMGVTEGIAREMMEVKALDTPFIDFNYNVKKDSYSSVLRSLKMVEGEEDVKWKKVAKGILKPVTKVLEAIRFGGSVLESLSKISGYSIMKEANMSDKERAYNTRTYIGTPNYRVGGKITQTTNAIWMFSNIFKEGMKTDLELATKPSTRGGWWLANIKINVLPKVLMWTAASGLMGGLLKELYDKIPEYDKTNYLCIPFGLRKDGRVNYIRVPHDETGRLMTGIVWKTLNALKDKELKEVQQIFAFGAGQLPGPAPALTMGINWLQYLTGKNPYDNFRGRYLVSETVWKAGGTPALKKMVQWTFNQSGLSQFTTYDDKRNETFDNVIQLTPVINRLIKSSDWGISQQLREIREEWQQESAQKTLRKREAFERNVERFKKDENVLSLLRDIKQDVYGAEAIDKRQLTDLKKGFIKVLVREEGNPYIDAVTTAPSNEEKAQILLEMKEFKTDFEFGDILDKLLKFKIISSDVIMKIKLGVIQ